MNMSRIENYNEEQKLYNCTAFEVLWTRWKMLGKTPPPRSEESLFGMISQTHLTVDVPAEDRAARHI